MIVPNIWENNPVMFQSPPTSINSGWSILAWQFYKFHLVQIYLANSGCFSGPWLHSSVSGPWLHPIGAAIPKRKRHWASSKTGWKIMPLHNICIMYVIWVWHIYTIVVVCISNIFITPTRSEVGFPLQAHHWLPDASSPEPLWLDPSRPVRWNGCDSQPKMGIMNWHSQHLIDWFKGKITGTSHVSWENHGKSMVSCRFSIKPTHWNIANISNNLTAIYSDRATTQLGFMKIRPTTIVTMGRGKGIKNIQK